MQHVCVEADLLQHVAKCTSLEELDVSCSCGASGGDAGALAVAAPSLLLRHVPALASCTRLECLRIYAHSAEDESAACSAQELLEPLTPLVSLQKASGPLQVATTG